MKLIYFLILYCLSENNMLVNSKKNLAKFHFELEESDLYSRRTKKKINVSGPEQKTTVGVNPPAGANPQIVNNQTAQIQNPQMNPQSAQMQNPQMNPQTAQMQNPQMNTNTCFIPNQQMNPQTAPIQNQQMNTNAGFIPNQQMNPQTAPMQNQQMNTNAGFIPNQQMYTNTNNIPTTGQVAQNIQPPGTIPGANSVAYTTQTTSTPIQNGPNGLQPNLRNDLNYQQILQEITTTGSAQTYNSQLKNNGGINHFTSQPNQFQIGNPYSQQQNYGKSNSYVTIVSHIPESALMNTNYNNNQNNNYNSKNINRHVCCESKQRSCNQMCKSRGGVRECLLDVDVTYETYYGSDNTRHLDHVCICNINKHEYDITTHYLRKKK